MERKIFFRKLFPVMLAAALLLLSLSAAAAEEGGFKEFISALKAEGTIPAEPAGTFRSYGDYTEELAQMHAGTGIPLLRSEGFVFSAEIGYSSGSPVPDFATAGCGLYFSSRDDAYSYMMTTVRMDGVVHLSGNNSGKYLSFKKYSYGTPNVEGTRSLSVARNGSTVSVWLDGEKVITAENIPGYGDLTGLAVLSGTNADFGTRCEFRDIRYYTWESAPAE